MRRNVVMIRCCGCPRLSGERDRPRYSVTGLVIPFPCTRRRNFIRRHAARMAELSSEAAERHLRHQVRVQIEALRRKGVAPNLVDMQRLALEGAIRAELDRLAATGAA